jgi:hypothetical protein
MTGCRLNLIAIESTLRTFQREFCSIKQLFLVTRRDVFDDEVLENMLAGYAFIDSAIAKGLDLLALGNLRHLIELNTLVLCGEDPVKREQFAPYREVTEKLFYDQNRGGIEDIMEWYEMHKGQSIWRRSAGVYVRMLSRPQLFIEGNHRTGALVMSYLLAREGQPPFVLGVDNAKAYFEPSSLIKKTRKDSLIMLFRMHKLKNYFADFLHIHCKSRHLICRESVMH